MGRLKHLLLAGVSLLDQGITDYAAWSQRMIQDFGPEVKPYLKDILDNALEIHGPVENRNVISRKGERGEAMPRTVLIVDDEPNIVLSLKFLVSQQGYDVRTAGSGEEALQSLREHVPDLVLLDIMMPKPDGYEVCQRIRATPEWKDIPVIMLTAKGRDVERQKGLAMGADDYITKPFSTRELVNKVKAMLEKK